MSHFVKPILSGIAAAFLAIGAPANAAGKDDGNPEGTVSTILLQTDHSWDGVEYKSYPAGQPELTVVEFRIPPNTTLPWHFHPMPNAAYVVTGTLCVERQDGKAKIKVHAGDVLPETVGTVHHGRSGKDPVVLLAFYAGAKGQLTAEQPKRSPHIHPGALPPSGSDKPDELPSLTCPD